MPDASVLIDPDAPPSKLCGLDEAAPILQFGGVFVDERILPSSVTMPVWHHVGCFEQWQNRGTVCADFRPAHPTISSSKRKSKNESHNAFIYRGIFDLPDYDNLVPQIIWRGTDFGFLNCMFPRMRNADWEFDISPYLENLGNDARGAMNALMEVWDLLTPRWRGVALAAKAELDAGKKRNIVKRRRKEEDEKIKIHIAGNGNSTHDPPVILAWIDAKFTVKKEAFGEPLSEKQTDKYMSFHDNKLRPTAAKHMPPEEMARYKYQIDFGGGGGTTFGSTAAKLAMPGLLFHHVTPTKDYFHDDLVPWVHYVPVATDVSDLRERFEWAEANPVEARAIAREGTRFARRLGLPEAFEGMYRRYYVENLGRVVEAYRPLGVPGETRWEPLTVEAHPVFTPLTLVAKCTGWEEKCTFVKEAQQWGQARVGAGDSWVLEPLLFVLSVACLAFIVFRRKTKTIDQSKNY